MSEYRLAIIPRKIANKFKGMDQVSLRDWGVRKHYECFDSYTKTFRMRSFLGEYMGYALGKFPEARTITMNSDPLFPRSDALQRKYDVRVLNKQNLLFIIDELRAIIYKEYERLKNSSAEEKASFFEWKKELWVKDTDPIVSYAGACSVSDYTSNVVRSSLNEWVGETNVSLLIFYEAQIFELVRLYKTFDWNKNALLFYQV